MATDLDMFDVGALSGQPSATSMYECVYMYGTPSAY